MAVYCHKYKYGSNICMAAFYLSICLFFALSLFPYLLSCIGFGNLAGEVDFWDRNKIVSGKGLLATITAHHPTTHGWSPDSRFFMTATTFPRLREGNKFQIFKYNGPLVFEENVKDLYQSSWVNSPKGIYPDRPQSPKSKLSKDGVESAPEYVAPVPVKKEAYRPPHATGALAAQLRREKGLNVESKKIVHDVPLVKKVESVPVLNLIPGQAPPSVPKNNNKKKKKEKDDFDTGACEATPLPDVSTLSIKVDGDKKSDAKTESVKKIEEPAKLDSEGIQKKIKNLQKKLKQIEELKEKQKAGGEINEDQLTKIKTVHLIKTEIAYCEKLLK